ncbi:hypothetical protein HAX54_045648 [Datura stramonium]|uniref:MADS-box domain-containing protein n=1 Tax=Datura stramonium TaxID=4076 RepID=A0ABS8RQ05_DATST|nr:hypothetical protein [Datura stramonium]
MKKAKMLTYKKRKETIKKKTRELSILCDTKACAILVGPNGEIDTWPENPTDLNPIIQSYKKSLVDGKRKVIDGGCLKKKSRKDHSLFCNDGDQWPNNMSRESKESLLVKLDFKLEAVKKRIEFLKMVNNGHWVVGDVGGSISSGKEIVLSNQETHNSAFEFRGSTVEIDGDHVRTSSGGEVVVANQENCGNSNFEFWGSTVAINGDQLENNIADQETHNSAFEFWGSTGISGDQLRDCSAYDEGQLVVMPNEMNMWETLNNLENVQNFGCDDLWPLITSPEFDLVPQDATGFGTSLNQQTLANDFFEPNYDYSIPFSPDTFQTSANYSPPKPPRSQATKIKRAPESVVLRQALPQTKAVNGNMYIALATECSKSSIHTNPDYGLDFYFRKRRILQPI